MIRLRVERSPGLLFLIGLVGLFLIAAAIDVVWLHVVSTAPDVVGDSISSLGRAQQRADFVWGAVFLIAGGALFAISLLSLLRRRPLLLVLDDGLEVFVSGPERASFLPWESVRSVRFGLDHDEDASRMREVLIVDVIDAGDLPDDPWGAAWVGSELHIDAGGWSPDATEVVLHAQVAMDEHRRDRAT